MNLKGLAALVAVSAATTALTWPSSAAARTTPGDTGEIAVNPDWSPNGPPAFVPHTKLLVFELHDPEKSDDSIWLMGRDGSNPRRLTTNPFPGQGADTDPKVSPDGHTVTFVRISTLDDQQALYSVRLDGSHLRQLMRFDAEVGIRHDWAPDGKHLVISINTKPGSHPDRSANLVTLRRNGGHLLLLTHFTNRDVTAPGGSYSPDGAWIYYRVETGDGEGSWPLFMDWGPTP